MFRRSFWLITLLVVPTLLAACQGYMAQPESGHEAVEPAIEAVAAGSVPAAQTEDKYGLVAGDINDGGFNQLAWAGLQRAGDELGVEVEYLQVAEDNSNAIDHITQFVDQGYSGIVTVGFGLGSATSAASKANPETAFVSVDAPSQTAHDLGLLFDVDAPAFMAGYLAAGMTESGIVCTFGGQQIPPVLAFMVGFDHGVQYYNEQNNADVALLGWETDPSNVLGGEGIFIGTFDDPDAGGETAEDLVKEGCDIIFPVAGASGLGVAEGAQEEGWTVIGVDADQTQTEPDFADVYLTSVVKQIDVAVYEAIKHIHEGSFVGGENLIGTLENDGVGLAPFHTYEDKVPQQLKDDLAQIEQGLIEGTISTGWPIYNVASNVSSVTVRRLTEEQLRNAAYPSEYSASGTAQLVDGSFEEEAAPGSASKNTVQLSDMIAFGDLDADGVDDAAVVLISSGGGSGTFYDLAVVLDRNGQPVPAATAFLGDRIQLNAISIDDGQVVLDYLTQGPDDPMPNPTQQVNESYRIEVILVKTEGSAANR
jgi:basic membrane protein A